MDAIELLAQQLREIQEDFRVRSEAIHQTCNENLELGTRTWQRLESFEQDNDRRLAKAETSIQYLVTAVGKHERWISEKRGFLAGVAAVTSLVVWALLQVSVKVWAAVHK